jgi:hypothetical protein
MLRVGCITQLEGVQIGSLSTLLKLSLSRITGPVLLVTIIEIFIVKKLLLLMQNKLLFFSKLSEMSSTNSLLD